ncbi:ferritin-like-domain-containing protein [Suillus paluster]|uniref:ferritin-like-domain-containing protein n=1 Tax=Suillus paluster TaxID=48578 RepID=UPI001B87E323|nr:ferritin-like-domain-containing protein [Suillus paluster]KAG1743608.1 ferritin-like-domain-containing protein [Suillus paluster]
MAPSKRQRQRQRRDFKFAIVGMLHDAIKVELTTIPHQRRWESWHPGEAEDFKQSSPPTFPPVFYNFVLVVAHQEMLHLALAGNLLTSIESGPQLYSAAVLPTYGPNDVILHSKIPLKLEPCGKSNLECFLQIEAPYQAPPKLVDDEENDSLPYAGILATYNSIGEFYTKLEDMIKKCGPFITFKNKNLQFSPTEFFPTAMTLVTDQESAHHTLKTIIDQGEGSVGVEDAHYQMFLELYKKHTEWECHAVPTSPTTSMYVDNVLVYALARASNAAYCYLLITIQKTWQVSDLVLRRALISNMHSIMINIITPLAEFMVKEPFGEGDGTAAPPFEFYATGAGGDADDAARKLRTAIKQHLGEAINATHDAKKEEALNVINFSVERVLWPISPPGSASAGRVAARAKHTR